MLLSHCRWALLTLFGASLSVSAQPLSFESAIEQAIKSDPQLLAAEQRVSAALARSRAVGELADPKLDLKMVNLPTDGFRLDQEPMTQLSIGVSQEFPRGDSRQIKSRQQRARALGLAYSQQLRIAEIRREVGNLWLDAYYWQQVERLIKANYQLFEHLIDVSNNQYASGGKRLADVVRAELELVRLDDRLAQVAEKQAVFAGRLQAWLPAGMDTMTVAQQLPPLSAPVLPEEMAGLSETVAGHPSLRIAAQTIVDKQHDEQLAKAAYEPAFRVSGSYGYRQDDQLGNSRADLLTIGVSMDLPLFTANRQDQQRQAAEAQTQAARFEQQDRQRQLAAQLFGLSQSLKRQQQRFELYQSRMLSQMEQQTEASLVAYTNNQGDFSEVMRASIAELNAEIEHQQIALKLLKTVNNIHYLVIRAADQGDSHED